MKSIFCYLKNQKLAVKNRVLPLCPNIFMSSSQNNFRNNLDCDTPIILNMPETKKPEEKAKREEFRRYLGEFILIEF